MRKSKASGKHVVARRAAVRKGRTVPFSRAITKMSTVKTVGLTLLAVFVLLAAIYIVTGAGPTVFHFGADIITPVAEALHSTDSDSLGGVTAAGWLANTQRPITTPCPAGQSIRTVNADGTVVCQPTDSHWTASGADIISNNAGEVQIGSGGAGTLNVQTGTICLGGNCRTTWPEPDPNEILVDTDVVTAGYVAEVFQNPACAAIESDGVCRYSGARLNYYDLTASGGFSTGQGFDPRGVYEFNYNPTGIPTTCYRKDTECTTAYFLPTYSFGCKAPFVAQKRTGSGSYISGTSANIATAYYDICDPAFCFPCPRCTGIICTAPP